MPKLIMIMFTLLATARSTQHAVKKGRPRALSVPAPHGGRPVRDEFSRFCSGSRRILISVFENLVFKTPSCFSARPDFFNMSLLPEVNKIVVMPSSTGV